MADCVSFHARIASIVEILANSAVAEICKLVDDGFAALRSQMELEREKSDRENDALRSKLREMEVKMWSYQMKLKRDTAHLKPLEVLDKKDSSAVPATPKEEVWNSTSKLKVQKKDHPISKHFSSTKQKADQVQDQSWVVVKQERDECNLNLKVQVNITADCGLPTVPEPNSQSALTDFLPETRSSLSAAKSSSSPSHPSMDLTCRASVKRRTIKRPCNTQRVLDPKKESITPPEGGLKPDCSAKDKVFSDESDRLNGLGIDMAWMQERVTHLGAAYAAAQLGLGATDPAHTSSSFPAQSSGESLDKPSSIIFPADGHDMAAFAAPFELSAAAASAPTAASAAQTAQPYQPITAKEPVLCQVCGRVFPSIASMELHQRVHSGERPYTCPHCGKGFAQPNNLRVHLLIHSGERRYRCTLCGKSFISSSHLKRHRTVHTQEKPYSCSRCGQSFSQMCSVRRHRQQSQCGL
ncbi:zinc finger protein 37 homolog [Synchiropus splendidus]|uniref:zinc finger protein 37 homolog n=1 Tax=Synchiropus splendidus TaxID=270530 RepID=UPI00237E806B|nr:zinc finger protein 37 homolog [Synchiropus splendidus]